MTLGKFCDLVLLRVTGGQPNTDNSVLPADIKALLPLAVNYAMDKTYNINLQQLGDRDYPSEFYATFVNRTIVRTGRKPYFTLAKGTVPLKVGMGLRFVYDNCGNQYAPLADADLGSIEYYAPLMPSNRYYRRKALAGSGESGETSSDIVELWNEPPIAATINYQALTKIEDLSDTDELPLEAGAEKDVMDILVAHFSGQRQFPYSNIINTKDINAAQV